jgi:hypothetical protein
MSTVEFLGYTCKISLTAYPNGQPRLQLRTNDREPVATASLSLPEVHLKPGEILVKNFAENEGLLEAIEDALIVKRLGSVPCGYAVADLCQLLV